MMALCKPDRYFKRITSIDIEKDLLGRGYACLLIDIDNTIRSREDHLVPEDVKQWMRDAQESGLTVCLFSNNWHASARQLGQELSLPVLAKAMKPLPLAYFRARKQLNCPFRKMVALGDQVLTDIVGARLVGVTAFLVDPLTSVDMRHTLVLRKIERRLIAPMQPE